MVLPRSGSSSFLSRLARAERNDLLNPTRVRAGRYAHVCDLSRGRFSKVVRAIRKVDRRHVALKILCGTSKRPLFDAEVTALHALCNRTVHVVRMHDAYELSGPKYVIVMDIAPLSLRGFMKHANAVKVLRHEYLMHDLFHALRHVHAIGFVHRDVKPENMLLCRNRTCAPRDVTIKLCDFGFSKRCIDRDGGLTPLCTLCGTPNYMAPELVDNRRERYWGPPVDIWAYGCVVFEFFHKKLAFDATSFVALCKKIVKRILPAGLPRSLAVWTSLSKACFLKPLDRESHALDFWKKRNS